MESEMSNLASNAINPGLFLIKFQVISSRQTKIYWYLILKSYEFVSFEDALLGQILPSLDGISN